MTKHGTDARGSGRRPNDKSSDARKRQARLSDPTKTRRFSDMDKKNADNCLGVRDRQAPSAPPSSAPRATSSTTDSVRGVNSLVETVTVEVEENGATTPLDPYTACATYLLGPVAPDCEWYGRLYYWYEPDGVRPAVDDDILRAQHPAIGDDEWEQLFYAALRRHAIESARYEVAEARRVLKMYEGVAELHPEMSS